MLKYSALALVIGFVLDLLIGDPRFLYHPTRIIGNSIALLEKIIRKIMPKSEKGELAGGVILVICICLGCSAVSFAILKLAFYIHLYLGIGVMSFMCYQMIATKSLKQESMKVYKALKTGTIEDARYAVSMIVGRDTKSLDEKGVSKAAVETIAENFSDGVFAPIFYMIIGGPVLMYFYKGINTMDSMVGYKNDKYLFFGRCAAKLDDVVNFVPARLAALFLILAAAPAGFDMKNAFRIFKRDRFNHASPNSAQTESVVAGALNIQLAGNAYYFGKLYEKPTMGDPNREVEPEDIKRANRQMYVASALAVIALAIVHSLIIILL